MMEELYSDNVYIPWLCLIRNNDFCKSLDEHERLWLLVDIATAVARSEMLREKEGAIVLKVFSNIFSAYAEWLGDFKGINMGIFSRVIVQNFNVFENFANVNRTLKKDSLVEALNKSFVDMPSQMRYVKELNTFIRLCEQSLVAFN